MKISISVVDGKIFLEDRIVDVSTYAVYHKAKESDLERYYDEFINHVNEIHDYFEDTNAFEKTLNEISCNKRPKLVSRDKKRPFWFPFSFSYLMPLNPKNRNYDNYFIASCCTTKTSKKLINSEHPKSSLDDKFSQYPDYEGILEIINDELPCIVKGSVFHEALHYLIFKYQEETGRRFTDGKVPENVRYNLEQSMHEAAVVMLEDKLLQHDKEALFEKRWLTYRLDSLFVNAISALSSMSIGILFGLSFANPYLLLGVIIPGRISDFCLFKYKESFKKELIKPREYPNFKI